MNRTYTVVLGLHHRCKLLGSTNCLSIIIIHDNQRVKIFVPWEGGIEYFIAHNYSIMQCTVE